MISLTDEDLNGVQIPHNDALVVTLRVGDYDIEKILVDQGSCIEVLHYKAFKLMGLDQAGLVEFITPLIGFREVYYLEWLRRMASGESV